MKTRRFFGLFLVLILLAVPGRVAPASALPGAAPAGSVHLAASRDRDDVQKALGTVYYVDQNHPDASDSNPGTTQALPWATIQYAVASIHVGDTIFVKAGTYALSYLNIANLLGAPDNQTVIQVFPGDHVVIEGAGVHTGRVRIDNCDYLTFQGFEITNFNQGLFVQGGSSHITIDDVAVHHVGQEAIHVKENSSHVLIQNSRVHDTRQWQYNGEGIYIGTGSGGPLDNTSYVTVHNCTIYNTSDEAIELKPGTHHCIVEGNVIYNVAQSRTIGAIEVDEHQAGVQYWGDNPTHVVRNNMVYSSTTAIRAGTGCTVYNNVIWNLVSDSYGIYVNNQANDNYTRAIYHNTIHLPSSRAVFVQAGQVDIQNNIGPSTTGNMETNALFFVDTQAGQEDFHLVAGSAPIDAGADVGIDVDLAGNPRPQGSGWDIGAYEFAPTLELHGSPGNRFIYLDWTVNISLPVTSTWQISYYTTTLTSTVVATDTLTHTARAYTLSNLDNGYWYTVTLTAVGVAPPLSDTATVRLMEHFVYLPVVLKEG